MRATAFAEITGKNAWHVLPKGTKNARDIFCQARSHYTWIVWNQL